MNKPSSSTGAAAAKSRMPRAVYLLSLCNGYLFINQSLLITISALIGFQLADGCDGQHRTRLFVHGKIWPPSGFYAG